MAIYQPQVSRVRGYSRWFLKMDGSKDAVVEGSGSYPRLS